MTDETRLMLIALMISTLVMMINIVAVSSGVADSYYLQLTQWLNNI